MRAGMERIITGKSGRSIIVVGHGGIFTVTMKDLCRNIDMHRLRGGDNHNCSLTTITIALRDSGLDARLVEWATFGHLSGAAADFVSGVPEEHTSERRRQALARAGEQGTGDG